ncbi:COG3014 family protein [Polaribacter butkevichii]|uniref:Lipoprotein n=1 Tax=Polaribacter butkevichii TaxID=218490 RepID=A0A2P6CDH3_9FLAO|nr:hypothetical protein [Polaribacter butkevichii]PQJ72898.1 hypothetical protein BTO14_06320 [Polaribacter butkevichii]
MKKASLKIAYCISFFIVFLFFSSCASYNTKSQKFQAALQQGNIEKALNDIDKNSFLKKNRNSLLYFLEKGKIAYLNENYELSNTFLNKADFFIEENKRAVGNAVLGVLLNPEKETYTGEDFEKIAIHYYKALNYIFLQKPDDALVEAKRINLQLQQLNDKYPEGKKNRYSSDAFALNLQGFLYEASGDVNNAFISYRNAADLYLANKGSFMGTPLPEQLKKDVLRTAASLGFINELHRYENIFGITHQINKTTTEGELILFWENGLVPFKEQNFFSFTVLPGKTDGIVSIYNKELDLKLPIPISNDYNKKQSFSDINIFNVAFPKYIARTPYFSGATILKDSTKIGSLQMVQNYEDIAFKTLKDRTLREIGKTAIRLGTKKLSESLLRDQNKDLGAVLGIFNAMSEHADTRNWQSLPNAIYYARIPLKKGENTISVLLKTTDGTTQEEKIKVQGGKGIQFKKIITLQSFSR